MKKIGSLWIKKGKGKNFYTGELDLIVAKVRIGCFFNDKKGNEKAPDLAIMVLDDDYKKSE